MEKPKRFVTEQSFREFCQFLEKKDQLQNGQSLHPSRLWIHILRFYPEYKAIPASGSAVDFESGMIGSSDRATGEFDELRSRLLLEDFTQAKTDFPNAAKSFRQILARAEGIWTTLRDWAAVQA